MSVLTGSVCPAERDTGTIHHRPLCIQDQQTTSSILQLETRPNSTCRRCILNPMGRPPPKPLPTLRIDQQVHREDQGGESHAVLISRTKSGIHVWNVSERTSAAPNIPGHPPEPTRGSPPVGDGGPPPSGHMAYIGHDRGFSEGVIAILRKSWRATTESAYSSVWRKWYRQLVCCTGFVSNFSTSEQDIGFSIGGTQRRKAVLHS